MDINYLLKREQVEMIRSVSSASLEARRCHMIMAEAYSARVSLIAFPARRKKPTTGARLLRRSLLGDSF